MAAKNTASLSRKFERRVLNHVWWCCSAGSINGWVKRLFCTGVGWFGCADCGCDCCVSVGIDGDWYGLIASRLAPTGWFWLVTDFVSAMDLCGSGGATIRLARDSGLSVDINVDCAAVIASKLGSYRVVVWQALSMVAGMASSRAGSLPQFWRGRSQVCAHHRSAVGVSLLAIAVVQSTALLGVPPSSRASSAPTGHRESLWERACSR